MVVSFCPEKRSSSSVNPPLGKADHIYSFMQDSFAVLRLIKLLVSVTLLCAIANAAQAEFNVMDYGAKADGVTDDSLVRLQSTRIFNLIVSRFTFRF